MEWFILGFFGLLAVTPFHLHDLLAVTPFHLHDHVRHLVAGRPSTGGRNRCTATPSARRAPAAAAEWDRVALLR
jgi:hypothetical protein